MPDKAPHFFLFLTLAGATPTLVLPGCGNDGAIASEGDATSGGEETNGSDATSGGDEASGSEDCILTANTSPTSIATNDCTLLGRDTSPCMESRMSAGLTGLWLEFSCRVTVTPTTIDGKQHVRLQADSQPDYPSNYFPEDHPCYRAYVPPEPNPNTIFPRSIVMDVPVIPDTSIQPMPPGTVGLSLNGIPLHSNRAAQGMDIYIAALSYDQCAGHPTAMDVYHYHSEPYSISYDDANFIGVMRDGYAVYGRRDPDGSIPTLDDVGGHTGPTLHSASPVYHYHVNLQTSSSPDSMGQTHWFITKGIYYGSPGPCTGC